MWRKIFGTTEPDPKTLQIADSEYSEQEIESIEMLWRTEQDPGPLHTAIVKFVKRAEDEAVEGMRASASSGNAVQSALYEGMIRAYQELPFELNNVARMRKVHRS